MEEEEGSIHKLQDDVPTVNFLDELQLILFGLISFKVWFNSLNYFPFSSILSKLAFEVGCVTLLCEPLFPFPAIQTSLVVKF